MVRFVDSAIPGNWPPDVACMSRANDLWTLLVCDNEIASGVDGTTMMNLLLLQWYVTLFGCSPAPIKLLNYRRIRLLAVRLRLLPSDPNWLRLTTSRSNGTFLCRVWVSL